MATLLERAIGAAKLDVATYEEVEHDASAMSQAVIVILVVSLAAGIGAATKAGLGGLLLGALVSFVGWFLWAAVTYLVGTRLLPGPQTEADFGQILRTLGFSASPGVFQLFAGIPVVGFFIGLAASLWQLAAMVVAVRQALDYESTGRAVAVCAVGFLLYVAIGVILGSLFSIGR
jgi:hypothetical protein